MSKMQVFALAILASGYLFTDTFAQHGANPPSTKEPAAPPLQGQDDPLLQGPPDFKFFDQDDPVWGFIDSVGTLHAYVDGGPAGPNVVTEDIPPDLHNPIADLGFRVQAAANILKNYNAVDVVKKSNNIGSATAGAVLGLAEGITAHPKKIAVNTNWEGILHAQASIKTSACGTGQLVNATAFAEGWAYQLISIPFECLVQKEFSLGSSFEFSSANPPTLGQVNECEIKIINEAGEVVLSTHVDPKNPLDYQTAVLTPGKYIMSYFLSVDASTKSLEANCGQPSAANTSTPTLKVKGGLLARELLQSTPDK